MTRINSSINFFRRIAENCKQDEIIEIDNIGRKIKKRTVPI